MKWILFYLPCLIRKIQICGQLLLDTMCLSSPYLWDYFALLIKCGLLTSQGDTLSTLLLFLIFLEQLHRDTWEKSTHHQVKKLSKGEKSCCLLSCTVSSHFSHSSYNHPNLSDLSRGTLWCKINRKLHSQDYYSNDNLNRLDLFCMWCTDQVCGNIHAEIRSQIKLFYSILFFYALCLTSSLFMHKVLQCV